MLMFGGEPDLGYMIHHRATASKRIEAYGMDHIKPRFHWIIDIVDQIRCDPQLDVLRKKEVCLLRTRLVLPLATEIPTLPGMMVTYARHYWSKFTTAQDEINSAKTAEEFAAITTAIILLTILFANIRLKCLLFLIT